MLNHNDLTTHADQTSMMLNWLKAAGLLLLVIITYSPTLPHGFVWDDEILVTDFAPMQTPGWDGLRRIWFSTECPDYYPLTYTSWWIEWRLWGMNPAPYRAFNIMLHGYSCLLIWLILKRLKIPYPWLITAIFAVHPLQIGTVIWIAQRKNTLAMAFYVSAIYTYLIFESSRQVRYYIFSIALFTAGMLSKAAIVMYPAVITLLLWYKYGRLSPRDALLVFPIFLWAFCLALITIWFQSNVAIGNDVVHDASMYARLALAGWKLWFYVWSNIWPYPLLFIYPRWSIDDNDLLNYGPGLVWIFVVVTLYLMRNKVGRGAFTAMSCFSISLFPVLGFFDIYFFKYSLVADYYQYFSGIFIIAYIMASLSSVIPHERAAIRMIFRVLAAALLMVMLYLNINQSKHYQTEETLWTHTLSYNDNASIAHNNLGNRLKMRGERDRAWHHYLQAARVNPADSMVWNNIALMLREAGHYQESLDTYWRSLSVHPQRSDTHAEIGMNLDYLNRTQQAIEHYRKALSLDSMNVMALARMSNAMVRIGQWNHAIEYANLAIRIDPQCGPAYLNLGTAHSMQGQLEPAIKALSTATTLLPESAEAHNNLAHVYLRTAKYHEAIKHFNQSLDIQPNQGSIYRQLGDAYSMLRMDQQSIHHYQRALELDSDDDLAMFNLASLLMDISEMQQAIYWLSKCLEINSSDAEVWLRLGHAYERLGDLSSARDAFRKVLGINPTHPIANKRLSVIDEITTP